MALKVTVRLKLRTFLVDSEIVPNLAPEIASSSLASVITSKKKDYYENEVLIFKVRPGSSP